MIATDCCRIMGTLQLALNTVRGLQEAPASLSKCVRFPEPTTLPPGLHRQSLFDLHAKISAKSGAKPAAVPQADGPSRDLIPTQTLESVAPVSSAFTRALDPNRKSNKRLARAIARVLFIAEFVLLIEFTEVMVPIIYGLYLGAMSNLPNRAHYPNLANLDDHQLRKSISRVVINAFFELSSFIGTTWIIRRQLKLSTTHIVAFVLESQASLVQASLVLWILYIIQQSLVHSGVDFTMRFAWLHTG